jgi:predicted acetyltransferase
MVRKLIYNHPRMSLKNHFIIKHKGRTVASLNLIPVDWAIGSVRLKAAEMGNVATLEQYRHKGLMRRLVDEYHKEVDRQGFDLSVIEGIPYFYRQFSYEYAITHDEETAIPIEKLPGAKSNVRVRPFAETDVPAAAKLLRRSQSKFLVHTVRDRPIWKIHQETGIAAEYHYEAYAVESGRKMTAYFRINRSPQEKTLILREVTDTDHPTSTAILAFLRNVGEESGLQTLLARISFREPIALLLASLGGQQTRPYAWQIRVTDYVRLLEKMKPLLESRLARSEYARLSEKLIFNFRRFKTQITVQNGRITGIKRSDIDEPWVLGLNPPASTQLLLGYRSREKLETAHPDFYVRPAHRRLIDVLFPELPSYIHAAY